MSSVRVDQDNLILAQEAFTGMDYEKVMDLTKPVDQELSEWILPMVLEREPKLESNEHRENEGGLMEALLVGTGTEATLRSVVVFSLDGQRYALPLDRVKRSIRVVAITPLPELPPIVLGIMDLGGVVIPVIDIRKRFGHPSRDVRLSDHLIVATTGRRTVALLVDNTKAVIEISPESYAPAGKILPGLDLVDGAISLVDGLVLIHDLNRLLSLDEERAIDRVLNNTTCIPVPANEVAPTKPKAGHRQQ